MIPTAPRMRSCAGRALSARIVASLRKYPPDRMSRRAADWAERLMSLYRERGSMRYARAAAWCERLAECDADSLARWADCTDLA